MKSRRFLSIVLALALCLFVPLPVGTAEAALTTAEVAADVGADTAAGVGADTAADAAADDAAVTEEPAAVSYAGVGLAIRGKVQGEGWGKLRKGGTTIGAVGGAGLNAVQMQLTGLQGITGSIAYQAYRRGVGWQERATDGDPTKSARNVEAIRIRLRGAVSQHYDVLYRTYISGRGWQPWVKNNQASGVVGERVRVNALQVKLSAKTMDALGKSASKVGIRYAARLAATGWQDWRGNGKIAGTGTSNRALSGFALKLDTGKRSGGVRYRTFTMKGTWNSWSRDGVCSGKASQKLRAVQIQLTGALADTYDIYYSAYLKKVGWLDWACNGETAGNTFSKAALNGLKVKLVKKGSAAPGPGTYPTIDALEAGKTLDGIDVASWQAGINLYNVPGDFVIVKATQGDWYTNPYFYEHANATLGSGKLLGTYHYADLRGSAVAQADFYVRTVKRYLGKCVLVLDWEGEALDELGPSWALKFMNRVYKKTGVKPLIYISQSTTWSYNWSAIARKYKLWLAQYLYSNMNSSGYLAVPNNHWSIGYWRAATMYQYSSTGRLSGYDANLDLSKFYGSAAVWRKLCSRS